MKTSLKYFCVCVIIFCAQNAGAQNSRSQRQAAKAEDVKRMVEQVRYVFKANFVNPQRGGGHMLTSDYDLKVSKDTLDVFLPYFGRAYVAPVDPTQGGIQFKTTRFDYKAKTNKKGGWDVVITPKERNSNDMRDVQTFRLSITSAGYATLNVTSTNRDPISFDGYIEEIKR